MMVLCGEGQSQVFIVHLDLTPPSQELLTHSATSYQSPAACEEFSHSHNGTHCSEDHYLSPFSSIVVPWCYLNNAAPHTSIRNVFLQYSTCFLSFQNNHMVYTGRIQNWTGTTLLCISCHQTVCGTAQTHTINTKTGFHR